MIRIIATLGIVFIGSSCASIMTGGTDDILVTSMPDGAYFHTNLGQSGRTPMTISVPDDQALAVSFHKDGFEDQSASDGTRMSAWVIGNIVFGGLIGLVVDIAADGNVHRSDEIHVELIPLPQNRAPAQAPPGESLALPRKESFEEWSAKTDPRVPKP